jgi:hypothetical protein
MGAPRKNCFAKGMEEHLMHRVQRYLASFILAGAMFAPVAAVAAPIAQDAAVQVRVYDEKHKDYHVWDDHENAAWVRFQQEKHWKEHEWAKATKREQQQYWEWRHSHPD